MPVYHSKLNDKAKNCKKVCKAAVLPLYVGSVKGPAGTFKPQNSDNNKIMDYDIVDEALVYFRANIFFSVFEVEGSADLVLVYLTAWIADCLRKLFKDKTKEAAMKSAHQIGINKKFKVPGTNGFEFGAFFDKPKNNSEKQLFVDYFQQIRHETLNRLIQRCYKNDGKQDKFWFQFQKRRFMNVKNM
mmetsp:Transcript_90175/g.110352  ORF Transcript_90175/g.110352 Transcript_90175/m.110352 type:complete len:187 (+) Transcript_90175:79-639(+)